MTTIYNYIMRKINQFEDYLLQPSQQTQPIQSAHHHTVKPKTPEKSRVVIDELRQQLEHRRTVKPKTPEELSVIIGELRQQLNII